MKEKGTAEQPNKGSLPLFFAEKSNMNENENNISYFVFCCESKILFVFVVVRCFGKNF